MKPVNTAERNSAFAYFLILFVITTALVVLAVFFGMQVPFKENERLQRQVSVYQNENAFADNFSLKTADTRLLIDSIMHSGPRVDLVNGQISANLVLLDGMVGVDSATGKRIYHDIVNDLKDMQTSKTALQQIGSNNVAAGQYQQQIQNLQDKFNRKSQEAADYRSQLIAAGINPVQSNN